MASMDLQKITEDLNRRFAAPLPEFYKRRIIFWYDEDKEFEDKLDELKLENASLLRLTGSNNFAAKKQLAIDDTASNYLVYSPLSYRAPDDDWLLNIELYSDEFRADLNSIWMDEMDLPNNTTIRSMVKGYHKFFNNADRRKCVSELVKNVESASQLHLAVMASICGAKDTRPASIIRAVLSCSLDKGANDIYQNLEKYGAAAPFWLLVNKVTGYAEGDDSDLGRLATHILLTATSRTMQKGNLTGYESFIAEAFQPFCYDLVSEWLHSDYREDLRAIARRVEDEILLPRRLMQMEIEELVGIECFPCVNECILILLMKDINNDIINVDTIKSTVEKRRTMAWYSDVSCYFDGLLQVANMHSFFLDHAAGFHLAQAKKVWEAYTADYYKMDTYYRQFHLCFGRSLNVANVLLDDAFKHVADKMENLYSGWFLGQLGSNWCTVAADDLKEYGHIQEVDRQEDFYREIVKSIDTKVFVIVSDALRYEVAASLAEQLRRDTQCKVTLGNMQAIYPTVTKFGMAALLPHKELTAVQRATGDVAILADGQSTDSGNRDAILKSANKDSVALLFKKIQPMKRDERQPLQTGMKVVYIYHDKIDESSHVSNSMVFPSCDDAITEIKTLVGIITGEFGGIRILITSDHGFLYTYQPLTEDDKLDKSGFAKDIIECDKRYCLMKKGVKPEYLQPVKFLGGDSDMDAFAPRENVRIRKSGGGMNFVHGGISLQEMVVPVIDYQFLRNQNSEYQKNKAKYDTKPVELSLLSSNRKIVNMLFSLNFFQKEAVRDVRTANTYKLCFTDSYDTPVSEPVRIIADKTSENAQDRTYRCNFNLKSLKFNRQASYYLVITDESGYYKPQKEEFQIDIAFALDDFNFLG